MSKYRYDTPADVQMRLHGTIIRYKGEPVQAYHNKLDSLLLDLYTLRNRKETKDVHSSDEDLDISSVPLGFVNATKGKTFLANRVTARRQNQGLSEVNVYIKDMYTSESRRPWPFSFADLADTIEGKYPKFIDSVEKLNTKQKPKYLDMVAFDRKLMLEQTADKGLLKLRLLNHVIGLVDDGRVKLFKEFNTIPLNRILEEKGVENAR